MKGIYKSLIATAVLLMFSACEGSVSGLESTLPDRPGTNAASSSRQVTVATQNGGEYFYMLGDGDNFTLFGVENTCGYTFPPNKSDENGLIQRNWYNLDDINTRDYSKVLRIDDDETLRQHYNLDYDTIDWSAKTLLLAYGVRLSLDQPGAVRFEKQEERKYLLTVDIIPSFLSAINCWRVAILVDKLESDAAIELTTPDYIYQD